MFIFELIFMSCPTLTCPNCHKKYKSKNSLTVHRSRDCAPILKTIYICKICNKLLKRKEYSKLHIYNNHSFQKQLFRCRK
ncbi:unnamed protein product [Callosobruchus maculatus]|uniref:C2H2-type domain-containing protein n=1 Tax=Callosobruchus maculatus TaxID=64391 RepID=A0A653BS92_CALMS|nr:unnamed protein product [Callosobruchus maculatus]